NFTRRLCINGRQYLRGCGSSGCFFRSGGGWWELHPIGSGGAGGRIERGKKGGRGHRQQTLRPGRGDGGQTSPCGQHHQGFFVPISDDIGESGWRRRDDHTGKQSPSKTGMHGSLPWMAVVCISKFASSMLLRLLWAHLEVAQILRGLDEHYT